MFSPYGNQKKRKFAPSIWSFDSGYGTQDTLEDGNVNSDNRAFYLHAGMSSNSLQGRLESSESLVGHGQAPFPAISYPACVSPAKYDTHDVLQKTANGAGNCLTCEVWSFTNPREPNLRCGSCQVSSTVQPNKLWLDDSFQAKHIHPETPTVSFNGRREPMETPEQTRCSACELSFLIDPSATLSCPSCTSAPTEPHPPQVNTEVRRSHARRHHKLPLSALNHLQAWLDSHQDDPYPSAEEKRQLAQRSGITEKQVTTWFTNARARQLSPLDTYLSSASEEEGASETDIASAALTPPYSADPGFTYLSDTRTPAAGGHRKAGSVSGSSAFSAAQSRLQQPSKSRRGKKKNYRRNLASPTSNAQSPQISSYLHSPIEGFSDAASSTEQELWQCTFCRRQLVPKSWRRHEETQHRPRANWTCMLDGPRLTTSQSGTGLSSTTEISRCAFCMLQNPSEDHFHTNHRIRECEKRPLAERTFLRPDHLRQHVKNFHGATLFDLVQARWKRGGNGNEKDDESWTCGFCGTRLKSWAVRETHIAGHFKEGKRMGEWREWPSASSATSSSGEGGEDKGAVKRSETVRLSGSRRWNPLKRVTSKRLKGAEADTEQDDDDPFSFGHGLARRLSRTLTRRSTRRSRKSLEGNASGAAMDSHIKQEVQEVPDPAFAVDFDGLALSSPTEPHVHATAAPMSMPMSTMGGFDYSMYQDCNNGHAPMLPDINIDPLMANANHSDISFMDFDIDWSQMGGLGQAQLTQYTSDPPVPGVPLFTTAPAQVDANGTVVAASGENGNGMWDPNTGTQYSGNTGSHVPGAPMQGAGWDGIH